MPSNIIQRAVSAPLHRTGRPEAQNLHQPQLGRKFKITWSPGFDIVTPGPTASTTPAPSWPSTIGSGGFHSPFITW